MSSEQRFSEFGPNSGYIEELYQLFLVDPSLVGDSWAKYFSQVVGSIAAVSTPATNGHSTNGHTVPRASAQASPGDALPSSASSALGAKAAALISAFRSFGHLKAKINPLKSPVQMTSPDPALDISAYGFSSADLDSVVPALGFAGQETLKLRDLISALESTYGSSIGFELEHVYSPEERAWLRNAAEIRYASKGNLASDLKLKAFTQVRGAEVLEEEMHRTYVGVTRFSLQGSESLMPLLDTIIETAGQGQAQEFIFGMAHRGRLNVLVNTVHKPLEKLFREFEDKTLFTSTGSGDVKYHMDYTSEHQLSDGKKVVVTLAPNPSHLEFVNPVVQGMARARQDLGFSRRREAVVPVLMHGDAAVIGQGIVAESLNLCRIAGHRCGGTIHIIINNQVGFTTNPDDSRSSQYSSDLAKAFGIPVLHVNGEDVEAVVWAGQIAAEFRQRFGQDIFIDLIGYRRWGHNEGDDPTVTQPVLYKEIEDKEKISEVFGKQLLQLGIISEDQIKAIETPIKMAVKAAVEACKALPAAAPASSLHGKICFPEPETAASDEALQEVAAALTAYPQGFAPLPKLGKIIEKRVETLSAGEGIEWGFAEGLAYGSLVQEGISVRLCGQDAGRGTFSQRHLLLSDLNGGARFSPLAALATKLGRGGFEVINSVLSENAVMGYEFGYSTVARKGLTLWEGQFGDFVNGAQVIIDQFVNSSEQKWGQLSGLVLLLPHGYEGRGPEHSSARLERFLEGCADNNLTVCNPTTAAQYFHLLRRQAKRELSRPLIVMTPKSLLRLAGAMSKRSELTSGSFQPIITEAGSSQADTAVLTCGKVYYDIKAGLGDLASSVHFVRLEQVYPFPAQELKAALQTLGAKRLIWAQEEPENMGAWHFVRDKIEDAAVKPVKYVGRVASSSTATGSGKRHQQEQQAITAGIKAIIS